jgi:exopolysaccharide biosynthesis protein/putative flippase GtrA
MNDFTIKNMAVIVPVYCPDEKLLGVIEGVHDAGFGQIFVVDDGSYMGAESTEQKAEFENIFSRLPGYVDLTRHVVNKGKGAALKTAIARIEAVMKQERERGDFTEIKGIVTVDADGQHLTEDIVNVSNMLIERPNDLILGSRAFDQDVPLKSQMGNTITRGVFALASGVKIRDTQTGLRAFSVNLIPFMKAVEGERYEYEMNMLLDAAHKKIGIKEVTIKTVYLDGNKTSHFHVLRDSALVYKNILKFSASSLIAFVIDFVMLFVFKAIFGNFALAGEMTLLMAVVSARLVSSFSNYMINKKLVFGERTRNNNTLIKYYLLASGILILNYLILEVLSIRLGMPLGVAKLIAEVTLFFVSYTVQKRFIFKNENPVEISNNNLDVYERNMNMDNNYENGLNNIDSNGINGVNCINSGSGTNGSDGVNSGNGITGGDGVNGDNGITGGDNGNKDKRPKNKRKLLPVPALAGIDVALAGVALCVFALFHHVLPSVGVANVSQTDAATEVHEIVFDFDGEGLTDDTETTDLYASSEDTSENEESALNEDTEDSMKSAKADGEGRPSEKGRSSSNGDRKRGRHGDSETSKKSEETSKGAIEEAAADDNMKSEEAAENSDKTSETVADNSGKTNVADNSGKTNAVADNSGKTNVAAADNSDNTSTTATEKAQQQTTAVTEKTQQKKAAATEKTQQNTTAATEKTQQNTTVATEKTQQNTTAATEKTQEVTTATTEKTASNTTTANTIFTSGEVISTDNCYKSEDISVTLTDYDVNGIVYHVEDIYIKNVENLRTAFADDSYGKGITEWPSAMTLRVNAVASINGDYYGTTSDSGAVIRNGILYRDNPDSEVLVMYYDGTMKVISADAFDGESEIANGAYQAWCFGPSLLDSSGNAKTKFSMSGHMARENPRTFIGYYGAGHYCFVTIDGRSSESSGATLVEEAEIAEALGCKIAYNLDGGKTSYMSLNGETVNEPADGGRVCSDIIYIAEIQ